MLVTSTTETPLNSVAFAGIMPRFHAGTADYIRVCAETWLVFKVGVVGKVFPWPLMQLLKGVIPTLVSTPVHTLLFIVEFILFFGFPLHIHCGVIRCNNPTVNLFYLFILFYEIIFNLLFYFLKSYLII